MKCRLHLSLSILLIGQLAAASDKPNRQETAARLEQAISKTNIFELPSFVMNADIQVEVGGKLVNGSYGLLWNGPNQWREELRVPGYTEVQIGGKGTVWVQRSTEFIPVPIYTLHQALGFGSTADSPESMSLVQPLLSPKDVVKKQRESKEHGEKLTCFEIEPPTKFSTEVCLNEATGTVARSPFMFTDSDFQPVGAKVFPRILVLHHESHTVAKVTVKKLSSPAVPSEFPPDVFLPPVGISPRVGCMNPLAPHAVDKPAPHYPADAREQYRQGTVSYDVLIGKDGVPQLQRLVESAGTDLDESASHAISRWRYDPATCGGQPVDTETVLQVNYALSNH